MEFYITILVVLLVVCGWLVGERIKLSKLLEASNTKTLDEDTNIFKKWIGQDVILSLKKSDEDPFIPINAKIVSISTKGVSFKNLKCSYKTYQDKFINVDYIDSIVESEEFIEDYKNYLEETTFKRNMEKLAKEELTNFNSSVEEKV